MDYYEHTASLPPALQAINEACWDMTGRPLYEHSYQIAIGKLCEISNDWDQFKANCDQFFFNEEGKKEQTLSLAWHCYIKGMHVLGKRLSEKT